MRSNDELNNRIMAERTDNLEQLSPREQQIAKDDGAVMRTVAENQAFRQLKPEAMAAPARRAMLDQVYRSADQQEEPKMTLLSKLFSGKRWYVQAGIGAALLVAVCVLALIPSQPSWGQVDGYVLVYDMGMVSPDADGEVLKDLQFKMQEAITRFKDENLSAEAGTEEIQVAIWVKVENENATMAIALTENDPELLAALRAELATIPELPEPTEQPSTWYFDGKGPCCLDGGVNIGLPDHSFYFPPGTSEEEMEKQIQQWLQEQHPGIEGNVEVNITEEDGKKRIEVKVEMPEGAEK